jgi:hypothetical protein
MRDHRGGGKTLSQLTSEDTLYFMAHGHRELPLFVLNQCTVNNEPKKRRYWSAAEIAALLQSDGLPKSHRNIHMLTCHAGESVASLKQAEARLSLFAKFRAAVAKKEDVTLIKAQYSELINNAAPSHYQSETQTFPLAAQLYRELYQRGYQNLRMIAYKAAVSFIFGTPMPGQTEPEIHLTLPSGDDVPVRSFPNYAMVISKPLFKKLGWKLEAKDGTPNMLSCW